MDDIPSETCFVFIKKNMKKKKKKRTTKASCGSSKRYRYLLLPKP